MKVVEALILLGLMATMITIVVAYTRAFFALLFGWRNKSTSNGFTSIPHAVQIWRSTEVTFPKSESNIVVTKGALHPDYGEMKDAVLVMQPKKGESGKNELDFE